MEKNEGPVGTEQQVKSTDQLETTRERLLQVAEDLFAEKGFDGTSVRKIGSLVGITISSIWYYFPTKRKLYMEVLRRIADDLRAAIADINTDGDDPVGEIHAIMERTVTWTQENPGRESILMREIMENPPRLEKAKDLVLADLIRTMRSPIDKLKAQGRLKNFDADLLLFHMLGAISYFAVALPTIGQIIGNNDLELLKNMVKKTTIDILDACITAE